LARKKPETRSVKECVSHARNINRALVGHKAANRWYQYRFALGFRSMWMNEARKAKELECTTS